MAGQSLTQRALGVLGRALAHYISQPVHGYEPFAITDPAKLAAVLKPADVLLVEGNHRISTAIKYLTQSTWSHAAMYVGDFQCTELDRVAAPVLIEVDLKGGVIAVPIRKYARLNTRICRPVGLSVEDCERVCRYIIDRLGNTYDLRNIIDLARYLLPVPPVPVRWRRRMLALGSGDPTRAICSTLIAQALQSVRYPILPHIERHEDAGIHADYKVREILHIRHYSLFAPRDFDISPFFRVIKPEVEDGFDYRNLVWADRPDAVDEGDEQAPGNPG
ncbi:MAG: lipo-like protein [Gammaproteobacteria bacterium]|nr:lipo-like protein [Gammaproteobacteria bacterium]